MIFFGTDVKRISEPSISTILVIWEMRITDAHVQARRLYPKYSYAKEIVLTFRMEISHSWFVLLCDSSLFLVP